MLAEQVRSNWHDLILGKRALWAWNSSSFYPFNCSLLQGRPRTETPLPGYVSVYSETLPNTSNQMFGSRIRTELGKELMRMDKLLMLTTARQKTKLSPEMQPCWRQVLRSEQTQR